MQISAIKTTASSYSLEQLKEAENSLLEEQPIAIEVEGEDEGEQLTHILAAIWVKEFMRQHDVNISKAIREYTVKVRNSIS